MKTISVLFGLVALLLAETALASAVATTVQGSAQVQTGTETPRILRQGDEVSQGDTVTTGSDSSAVLKFDDGEIAALAANSRMQITTYRYEPQTRAGSVLLSLITGGMRAITGLIGHAQPNNVSYRAATATIGIRGTSVDMAAIHNFFAVIVNEGSISLTMPGFSRDIAAGQGIIAINNQISGPLTTREVYSRLPLEPQHLFNTLQSLSNAINDAAPGVPRQGGNETGAPNATSNITPTTVTFTGSTGGGNASAR